MESPHLRGLFLSAYHKSFSHLGNTEAMFSQDIFHLLLMLFDNRFTGEHNASVRQAKNPKAQPDTSQLKEVESIIKINHAGLSAMGKDVQKGGLSRTGSRSANCTPAHGSGKEEH